MELLLTLGHNSSAVAVRDGKVIAGYEEERFDRLKSSSIFPIQATQKCLELAKPTKDEENTIFVSHWFDDFDFRNNKHKKIHQKYWDDKLISKLEKEYGFVVDGLDSEFTHHDAHAYAVTGFYEFHNGPKEPATILVADGFGNKQEVMSVYKLDYDKLGMRNIELVHRSYGYENSLGLFYQYATSFVGMQENQDEYKFLGYESHIHEIINQENYDILQSHAKRIAGDFIQDLLVNTEPSTTIDKEYINLEELNKVKQNHWSEFEKILSEISFVDDKESFNKRVIIGNLIQTVLETVCVDFANNFEQETKTLLVNGGIFYNVKLNNKLARASNAFCVIPLAGDQGAAIGSYINHIGPFDFSNLFWGKRNIKEQYEEISRSERLPENCEFIHSKREMADRVSELLLDNEIVQVVVGDMEFGPRALCHSTTYAVPYKKNVELINTYNKRNTVMPMAPIMLRRNLDFFFNHEQYEKTIGSDGFMILTYDYELPHQDLYSGVMHKYPDEELYSGRPQVVDEDGSTVAIILEKLDKNVKALINTSYNVHGKPIVYTAEHAIDDFKYQLSRCEELNLRKPYLFIGTYED